MREQACSPQTLTQFDYDACLPLLGYDSCRTFENDLNHECIALCGQLVAGHLKFAECIFGRNYEQRERDEGGNWTVSGHYSCFILFFFFFFLLISFLFGRENQQSDGRQCDTKNKPTYYFTVYTIDIRKRHFSLKTILCGFFFSFFLLCFCSFGTFKIEMKKNTITE